MKEGQRHGVFAAIRHNKQKGANYALARALPYVNTYLQHGQGQLLPDYEVSHEAGQTPRPSRGAVIERLQRVPERHLKRKPCGGAKQRDGGTAVCTYF